MLLCGVNDACWHDSLTVFPQHSTCPLSKLSVGCQRHVLGLRIVLSCALWIVTDAVHKTSMSRHMMLTFRCSVIHVTPISTQKEEKSLTFSFPHSLNNLSIR